MCANAQVLLFPNHALRLIVFAEGLYCNLHNFITTQLLFLLPPAFFIDHTFLSVIYSLYQ